MNIQEQLELDDEKYGMLFDVRRSIRYHDRRRAFLEGWHRATNFLTILMAGSVLFDLAKAGDTASWMIAPSVAAALLAVADMVLGYAKQAAAHERFRSKFSDLEIQMLSGDAQDETWTKHQIQRLEIEKDEPPIYKVLDGLCRNEVLVSEGHSDDRLFNKFSWLQVSTQNYFRWENALVV